MRHRIKMFLYYHSFHILFKRYRDKWFMNQLRELIKETLKQMPKGYWEKAWSGETPNQTTKI